MKKVLVLPGIAKPEHMRYRPFYNAIIEEGRRRADECILAEFPGQNGDGGGRLSFTTASTAALISAKTLRPGWVIGISFGALVALALAGQGVFGGANGLVLLGSTTREGMRRVVPDEAAKVKAIERYSEELDTWLDNSFFESLPAADDLIGSVSLPVRLIRGEFDQYNSMDEFNRLCDIYRATTGANRIETLEIKGAEHSVLPDNLSDEWRSRYFDGLFGPIS